MRAIPFCCDRELVTPPRDVRVSLDREVPTNAQPWVFVYDSDKLLGQGPRDSIGCTTFTYRLELGLLGLLGRED